MRNFFRKKKGGNVWDCEHNDPIGDMRRALMLNHAMSEREAEIMIEGLMGKREYDIALHCDLMFGKWRRSLEK